MSLTAVAPVSLIPADLPAGPSQASVATTAAAALTAAVPVPASYNTIQDFAALFKALASGSVSRAQAALATVLSDLSIPPIPVAPNPTASLHTLLEKMQNSLSTSGTDAALHDAAAYLLNTPVPTSGTLINTTG